MLPQCQHDAIVPLENLYVVTPDIVLHDVTTILTQCQHDAICVTQDIVLHDAVMMLMRCQHDAIYTVQFVKFVVMILY